jgi:hypothetical protein
VRRGRPVNLTDFGTQTVQTRVYHVLPDETPALDIARLLAEAEAEVGQTEPREEAWVL